tara:strand:- start:4352 stop:4684 length:333 start_codon:yes stop_codon:yes gene_type:complete
LEINIMPQYVNEMLVPLTDAVFATRTVSYTGTAGSTATIAPGPGTVWVWSTSAAFVIVGEGVTATSANGLPIAANVPVTLEVPNGSGAPWRVSAIQIASSGDLYVKALAN